MSGSRWVRCIPAHATVKSALDSNRLWDLPAARGSKKVVNRRQPTPAQYRIIDSSLCLYNRKWGKLVEGPILPTDIRSVGMKRFTGGITVAVGRLDQQDRLGVLKLLLVSKLSNPLRIRMTVPGSGNWLAKAAVSML